MNVPDNLIERWNKNQEQPGRESKRRLYIIIGASVAVVLFIVLFCLFTLTDLFVKPVTDIKATSEPGEWAIFGRDLTRSGVIEPADFIPQGTVTRFFTTGAPIRSSPVIADGVIYFGSQDGFLYALDIDTGKTLWQFKTGSFVDCTPVVVDNKVLCGSNDGNFYALDADTGKELWRFDATYPIKASPAVADGKVYFGGDDHSVYALDIKTGKKVWSKPVGSMVLTPPAVANGIVYFGTMDGNLYALNARNGWQRLRFPVNEIIASAPAVVDDVVYFTAADGFVFAVDGKARNWFGESVLRPPWMVLHIYGDLPAPPKYSGYLWSLNLKHPHISSPTISGDYMYFGLGNSVVSVDLQSQEVRWRLTVSGSVNYASVLTENTVYAVTSEGWLFLLDASSGQKISAIKVGGPISTAPVAADGKVYITSEDGNLYTVE